MSETQEIIKKQLATLPKDLRDAVVATDLPEKFKTIANKHKLRTDQSGVLETETMFVMLGIEHPDDYTNNLKREADISEKDAAAIAEEVNRMIFLPIRASLKKLHGNVKEDTEKEKVSGRIEHPPLADAAAAAPDHPSTKTTEPQTPSAIKERLLQSSHDSEEIQTRGAPDKVDTKDIFRQKLEGQMKFAKEETQLDKPKGVKNDPYKEPIEEKDTRGIVQEGLPAAPASAQAGPKFDGNQEKNIETPQKTPAQAVTPSPTPLPTPPPPLIKKKFSFDSLTQKPAGQVTEAKSKEQSPQKTTENQVSAVPARHPTNTTKKGPLDNSSREKKEEKITAPKWKSGRDRAPTEAKDSLSKKPARLPEEVPPQRTLSGGNTQSAPIPQASSHVPKKEVTPTQGVVSQNRISRQSEQSPQQKAPEKQKVDANKKTGEKEKPYKTDPYREPIE